MASRPTILILAAGASSRMAPRDKLMELIDGVPLLRDRALAALATGAPVVVTLPPDRPDRAAALTGFALNIVFVAQASEGMGRSLADGAAALADEPGIVILPADMPDIATADLDAMMRSFAQEPEAIHRGASAGRPGHPVIFPADLIPALAALRGDEGARDVLHAHAGRVRLHPLPDHAALTDLDTAEAWEEWRAWTGR